MTDDPARRPVRRRNGPTRDCAEATDPHDRKLVIKGGDPANLSGFEVVEMVTERPQTCGASRIVDSNTVL